MKVSHVLIWLAVLYCSDLTWAALSSTHEGHLTKRKNITFVLGDDDPAKDPFFSPATYYYRYNSKSNSGELQTSLRSLEAVRNHLEEFPPANGMPWGIINLVVHSSKAGIKLAITDEIRQTTALTLQKVFKDDLFLELPNTLIDRHTEIHIQGCGIGYRKDILKQLSELFGGKDSERPLIRAPFNLIFYESIIYQNQIRHTDKFIVEDWSIIIPKDHIFNLNDLASEFSNRYPKTDVDWHQILKSPKAGRSNNNFYEITPLTVPIVIPSTALKRSQNLQRFIRRNKEIKKYLAAMGYTRNDFGWRLVYDKSMESGKKTIILGEANLVKVYSELMVATEESKIKKRFYPEVTDPKYFASVR